MRVSLENERHLWPYNLRWTMAMMTRLEAMAVSRKPVHAIAFEFDTTETDIRTVCQRNNIYIWR